MKQVLEPLVRVTGVRRAMMIATDGVPIVCSRTEHGAAAPESGTTWHDSADDVNAFAGLAAGWLAEVHRAVDPMSWAAPERLVLRAARGTLILLASDRVLLSVELERGASPEELRLPMEAALARLQRTLRRGERSVAADSEPEIPGIFPGQAGPPVDGDGYAEGLDDLESLPRAEACGAELQSPDDPNSAGQSAAPNHSTGNQAP